MPVNPSTITPGTLKLSAMSNDAPPLMSIVEGHRVGFEADLGRALAGELGLTPEWVSVEEWGQLRVELDAGRCDAIICCQAITPERQKEVAFTRPYASFDEGIVVRADSDIHSAEDLAGRTVGAVAGTTNIALARSFTDAVVVEFGSGDDALGEMCQAVLTGEVDAMIDDELLLPAVTESGELRVAFVCATRNPCALALRKDSGDLVAALDEALTRMFDDGRMRTLWDTHFTQKDFPFE
jgi:polar amino acid transport system substrate-binding protein